MPSKRTTEDETLFNQVLGRNLKYLRKQKGYNQTRAANVCNVSFQQYQKYEKGINAPHPSALVKYAKFYKTSIDRLCSQNLVDDLEQFKSRVKNLEIATVDGVAVPMEGMNHEIDALINKINKNSEMFLQNKPLVFKFKEEVDPWL
ncbi:MAG TPA: hypothetical protein DCM40_07555 [Maribacter sp.]|jgi:transcriptional regulator with XRE-family HTH domain|nr:hypothetical protein [Maribacter sp.]